MASIKNIVPGQVLYSVSECDGNTTRLRKVIREITVIDVDHEKSIATVKSSSGTRICSARDVARLRVNKPVLAPDIWDKAFCNR